VVALIAGVVILGGGAFAGYKLMGGSKTEATQAVVTPVAEPPKAAAEPAKAAPVLDPPPAPPASAAEAKVDAKAAEVASAAPVPGKLDPHQIVPIAKARPIQQRPAPPAAKPPAKPGTPDFGY
jgi:hypothetical protein